MQIKVNLTGMKEVEEALENAKKSMDELYKAVAKINHSLDHVGVEVTQPPEVSEAE